MSLSSLPTLNAILNGCATILLIAGYIAIKKGNRILHRNLMVTALLASAAFLTSYLIFHAQVASVKYPLHDWTRPVYFVILIPHIILAAAMVPGILALVWFAIRKQFDRHKKVAKIVWPVWIYVSITGVVIYWMLYHLAGATI